MWNKPHNIYCILQIFYFLHTGQGGGMHTAAFQLVNLKETDYLEDLSRVGRIRLIHTLIEQNKRMWTGFIWLIKWANGGLL